jgi:superoxide reductase
MTLQRSQIFQCTAPDCPATVEVLTACEHECDCNLQCCEKPMKLLAEKTTDAGNEKHVPVIEEIEGGYKVKVGSVPHPMEEDHWIQWIELRIGDSVQRTYLNPGEKPEASFITGPCCGHCGPPTVREFCNKHGLWGQ